MSPSTTDPEIAMVVGAPEEDAPPMVDWAKSPELAPKSKTKAISDEMR
jgi:hypothetical protein